MVGCPRFCMARLLHERSIMKIFVFLGMLCLITACGTESAQDNVAGPPPGLLSDVSVTVDGMDREYDLYVPDNTSNEPRPLLLAFHGGSGRDYPYPQQSKFQTLADTEGFLIAYPLAELLSGNEGEWQLNTRNDARHDIRYVESIIDQIASRFHLDESKIYATGYSLGSMFTYELACHMSDRFAAIASHAGTMPVSPNSCEQERNVSIMHLHGSNDSIISYDNAWDWKSWDSVGTMMDVPSLVEFWKNKYNCQSENQRDTSNTQNTVYYDCDEDARVEHHRINGADHEWPESLGGDSTHEVIWTFLDSFSKD